MDRLTENLDYFLKKFGQPVESSKLPDETVEWLDGRVPGGYIEFLRSHGASIWLGGYFQLLDPLKFDGLVKLIFEGDPDIDPRKTTAIASSATGALVLWNETHRKIDLDFLFLSASGKFLLDPKPERDPGISFGAMLTFLDQSHYGGFDYKGRPLAPKLLNSYGVPPIGHIFAPKLHPALGGSFDPMNFRPVPAVEAMGLMANAGRFILKRFDANRKLVAVRPIGATR